MADLLGWQLPEVATYTGDLRPLYLDVIFPFLIVDQQSWGTAGPRKVERYQIRESTRRATEFLLALTGPVAETRRAELEQTMAGLRTRWAAARTAVDTLAGAVGGRVVGVPEHAAGAQARAAAPEPTSPDEAALQVLETASGSALTRSSLASLISCGRRKPQASDTSPPELTNVPGANSTRHAANSASSWRRSAWSSRTRRSDKHNLPLWTGA